MAGDTSTRKRRRFFGLRGQLAVLALSSVVPIAGLFLYIAKEQWDHELGEAREEALRRVQVEAAHEDRLIDSSRQLLATIALVPEVNPGDSARCTALLSEVLKHNALYLDLGVIDSYGRILCSALPPSRGADVSRQRHFQEAMERNGFAVGNYHIEHPDAVPGIDFGYRLTDPSRGLDHVLYCTARIDWIASLTDREHLSDEGSVLLIDARGQILARYPNNERWSGKNVSATPYIQHILAQRQGTVLMEGLDGVVRLHGFVPLGSDCGPSAYLVVGFDESAFAAPARRFLLHAFVLLGIVSVVTLVAAVALSEVLVLRRVRQLASAAEALREGDIARRARLTGHDELSDVSHAFDSMADALSDTISRERSARADAVHQAQRLQVLIDLIPDGVVLIGVDGDMQLSNKNAQWLVGPWSDRPFPEVARSLGLGDHLKGAASGTQEFETEQEGRLIAHTIARTSSEGPLVWVFRDLTVQRRLLGQVIQKSKLADLGLLAAGVAHEIGNPLSSIAATVEVLQMKPLNPDIQSRLRTVRSGLGRIDGILKDITGFAKPSQNRRSAVMSGDLVTKALSIFKLHAKSRGKSIAYVPDDSSGLKVDVVEDQMVQVLLNLLLNAADATNGDTGRVGVTINAAPSEVQISISDSGPGMPEDVRRRLFMPFFTTKEPGKGVGLGLFVSDSIVRAHGGRIDVSSEPGKGSTFTVCLPATARAA